MNDEDIEKVANAVSAAVKVALKHESGGGSEKAEPKYDTIVSNGKKYVELKATSVGTVIDELNTVFHPTSHDFLSCKICRSLFDNKIKRMGYEVIIKEKPQSVAIRQKVRKVPRKSNKK